MLRIPSLVATRTCAQAIDETGLYLEDAAVGGARGAVGALDELHALGEARFVRRGEHGIQVMAAVFFEPDLFHFRRAARDAGRHARGFADFFGAQVVAVGVAGALARDHAHADAERDALDGALDDGFVDAELAGGEVFEVQVGVIAAGREGLG